MQEESLKGKTKTLANIEELDRLLPLLKEAVAAEVSQKLDAVKEEIEAAAIVKASEKAAEEVLSTSLIEFSSQKRFGITYSCHWKTLLS